MCFFECMPLTTCVHVVAMRAVRGAVVGGGVRVMRVCGYQQACTCTGICTVTTLPSSVSSFELE